MKKHNNIDEYIADFPVETQQILNRLRDDLQQMVPNAKQKISYAIPTFTLNGNLIHFAGYKNHIGLYPGSKAIEVFADDLKGYQTSKGTIQFPIEKPLPMVLIKKIVDFCVVQKLAKKISDSSC
ncbi:iron chaperone [Pedobacter sp.]